MSILLKCYKQVGNGQFGFINKIASGCQQNTALFMFLTTI